MLGRTMARSEEGLRNEALRAALAEALAGRSAGLEAALTRHGMLPNGRPNLVLAAAFGTELAEAESGAARKLLSKLAAEDAAPNTPRVFLPVAAAHGWAGRIRAGKDEAVAYEALGELAADERTPVRLGTLDALLNLGLRPGGADTLVEQVSRWLDFEERELRFGATASAVEVLSEPRLISALSAPEPLLEYLSRAIAAVADAPRAAERSEGRRRLLLSLPKTLAEVVAGLRGGDRGRSWLIGECERAEHPDVRRALSLAIEALRTGGRAQGVQAVEALRKALEGSAKPLRDPTRLRPGTGRGKHSRRTR